MIWLTWRQFRVQFLVVAAVALAATVVLAVTGPGVLDDSKRLSDGFLQYLGAQRLEQALYAVGQALLYAVPPVVGAFWGAPLIARELETGTHRLVWAQSISRWRWLATKVAFTGLAAVGVTALLSAAVTWWADPIDDAVTAGQNSNVYLPRLFPAVFSARGLVPVGYAAFAFALGVAVGLLVRRTLIAVAVTLAVVILVQVLTPAFVRQHLMTPTEKTAVATADSLRGFLIDGPGDNAKVLRMEVGTGVAGAWRVSEETVDKSGQVVKQFPAWVIDCEPGPPPGVPRATEPNPKSAACFQRLADEGYHQEIRYFGPDAFWSLQWREFGLFLGLAVLLTGFSFWRIRRDLS
jgi:hypothetical protein